jgi:hypothetical protein
MNKALHTALAAFTALLAACGGGGSNNAEMRPGENCLACHSFSVAGTVFPTATSAANAGLDGVSVIITDANGAETTLTTNAVGNFYTGAALAQPLRSVRVVHGGATAAMVGTPTGACSTCHALPPSSGAPGRVYVN